MVSDVYRPPEASKIFHICYSDQLLPIADSVQGSEDFGLTSQFEYEINL